MLSFEVDKEKSINALLFLMQSANERGICLDQYQLVKSVFLADRTHLNKYGRPITFDRYVAMVHGPVPSFAYDALKPNFQWKSTPWGDAPWKSQRHGKVHKFSANHTANLKKLSKSDRACLSDALVSVLSLDFGQIRKLTHEDPAYVAAWRDEEGTYAFPMDMAKLLDGADEEMIDDLMYLAEHTRTASV